MKYDEIKPEHKKILLDIQKSIPQEWTDRVSKREDIAPATKEILEKSLTDDEVDENFKKQAKIILDGGFLDKQIDVEVPLVAELIEAYTEKEILKAVIAKKLPPLKKKQDFTKVYKRYQDLKQKYDEQKNS